jgi:hypothetical protein
MDNKKGHRARISQLDFACKFSDGYIFIPLVGRLPLTRSLHPPQLCLSKIRPGIGAQQFE